MDIRYTLKMITVLVGWAALAACSVLHQTKPVKHSEMEGAYLGGGLGFGTGLAVTSTVPVPLGVAVGSAFGLTTGDYHSSVDGLTKLLESNGAQVIKQGDSVAVYLPSDLVFRFGTHEIKPEAYSVLTAITAMAKLYTHAPGKIRVLAYTDNVMSAHESYVLTDAQVQSIAGYMWAEGIPHEAIRLSAKGRNDPIASNLTPIGSAANRRIEVHFTTV